MTITLPADLEKLLERAAQSRGLPIDAYARAVLEEAAKSDRETLLAEIDHIRAMTPTGPQIDSAELLHRARGERYDRTGFERLATPVLVDAMTSMRVTPAA